MDAFFYTFRSITRAQLAMRVLEQEGVYGRLIRTPKALAREGCGYAIRIRNGDDARAERIFRQQQIAYQRKFLQNSDGRYLEVQHDLS